MFVSFIELNHNPIYIIIKNFQNESCYEFIDYNIDLDKSLIIEKSLLYNNILKIYYNFIIIMVSISFYIYYNYKSSKSLSKF